PVCVASIEAARQAYDAGLKERLAIWHGANVECAFRGWNDAWLDPEFLDWNIEEYLPGIAVPILVIQGEDDEYGTIDEVRAIGRQAAGGGETLLLENCRHSPQRDRTDAARAAIARFARRVSAAPSARSRSA